ncbi:MAG TPA: cytochrome c3 family protein [bacterium]|nr:cytochrome c3 family protein [bacterium]
MSSAKTLFAALFSVILASSSAFAFHDAGVADCAGCHTMHNSQDGALVTDAGGYPHLLKAASATDACLICHAGYGQFAGGEGHGPGGDFYWLTKTYSWSAHGHVTESTGDSHGHNVVSPANGIQADGVLLNAPGGTFDSDEMKCTACHDPHGNQNFRLLYGSDFGPEYQGGRFPFSADAPLALGNSRRTINEDGNETDSHHTVYKSGMSMWCSNCHPNFHSDNTLDFVHRTDEDMNGLAAVYNAYVSSDDLTSGSQATAYWGLVPFEDVDVDLSLVDPANYTQGPASNDRVMCLSCHRSHASAFPDIGRWDFGETFVVDSHPQLTDMGATAADVDNKYYDYTFVQNQRSLCNKCHAKDAGDAGY